MNLNLLCLLLCVHMCLASKEKKDALRIVGGRNATQDEFPFVVKLMLQTLSRRVQTNIFICTASTLSPKWTLTAGHCIITIEEGLMSTDNGPVKAVIEYQLSSTSSVAYSEVISTSLPPNINIQTVKNDIGLLRTQPVLFSTYGKLSPIDYGSLNGQPVALVGFGMIKNFGERPPVVPQVLDVVVKTCVTPYHYPQLCFAPSCSLRMAKAVCSGDSGGPAVHASGIVSVNSMTDIRNCGMSLGPTARRDRYDMGYDVGTATPVSPYIDWISKEMKTQNAS